MKNKNGRIIWIAAASVIAALVLAVITALAVLQIRTASIQNDYSSIYSCEKYSVPVSADGVNGITQDVSCGYAVLEMFSSWCGYTVTEESLYAEYGGVVTSTGRRFAEEMNRWFPEFTTEIRKYLKNTELIDLVYNQLSEGIPVPIEWAALHGDEWTLHYSLVTGMDIPNDRITVANPYGYFEEITVDEFLERTSFRSFENMPLLLRLGFAFGVFEKNTVFSVDRVS